LTVTIGTLSANCLNLYSGSISALTAWDSRRRQPFAAVLAVLFGALTAGILSLARAADPTSGIDPASLLVASGAVAVVTWLVIRYTLARWQAALAVGLIGGGIALAGTQPGQIAHDYANFLLLLSSWAAPWAGAMLASLRHDGHARPVAMGFFGWLAGIAASLPFWQQSWFTGPIATRYPALGDISYFVGFGVAYVASSVLLRFAARARVRLDPNS
jgi:purine-cytosine permease-like protein